MLSHDPSDVGGDAKAQAIRHGIVFTHIEEIDAANGNRAFEAACNSAIFHQVDKFIWDCDGMGALLRDAAITNFKGKPIKTFMYKGSEAVHNPEAIAGGLEAFNISGQKKNKDVYKNKRVQNYVALAVRMYNTYLAVEHREYINPDDLISFSSDIKSLSKLRSELCRLPTKPGNTVDLYSKQEMRKGILMPDGSKLNHTVT